MASFNSADEFREVIDRTFGLMAGDSEIGPKLREANTPQRWEFPDLDLVVNVAAAEDPDQNLVWEWSDDVEWEPAVRMTMSSDVANRYFQGKENIAMAIARRRIKTSGDVKKALALVPVTKPVFALYLEMCERDYPHLVVDAEVALRSTRRASGTRARSPPTRSRPLAAASRPARRRRRPHARASPLPSSSGPSPGRGGRPCARSGR